MEYESILLQKENWIARITLNRPDRLNAIIPKMAQELLEALAEVDKDDDARVLILTGAGKGFCAGADVGGMTGGTQQGMGTTRSAEDMRRYHSRVVGRICLGLQKMQKPTIAMVNGVAVGGGFDMALA